MAGRRWRRCDMVSALLVRRLVHPREPLVPGRASIGIAPLTARYLPLISARTDVRADATLAIAPAVVATVPRAPRPPAKPGHKRCCRTSSAASARLRARARSSPGVRTAERSKKLLADAPRRPHPASQQQLAHALAPPAHAVAHGHEHGHGRPRAGEPPCPCRRRGNRVGHASSAIAPPQPGTRRRSTVPGGTEDETTGSTPSGGSDACVESLGGLDLSNSSSDPAPGPRGGFSSLSVKPRRGAANSTSRRFILGRPRQPTRRPRSSPAHAGGHAAAARFLGQVLTGCDPQPRSATVSGPPTTGPSGPPAVKHAGSPHTGAPRRGPPCDGTS